MDKKKRKNKKGFTLVELLATIVILSIIVTVSLSLYNNYSETSKEKLIDVEKKAIIRSAGNYYDEYSQDKSFRSEVKYDESGSKIVNSCIKLKNLIDKGFYTKKEFLDEKIDLNKYVVKITEKDGIKEYKLIKNYDSTNTECNYTSTSREARNEEKKVDYTGEEDYKAHLSVLLEEDTDHEYMISFGTTAEIIKRTISEEFPIYVSIVLDSSGSMYGRINQACSATEKLSTQIYERFDNSKTELVTFGTDASVVEPFNHQIITTCPPPNGGTYTLKGLQLGLNNIKNIATNDTDIKYMLLLTDGVSHNSDEELTNIATTIKEENNINLIVIGYDMYYVDLYKNMSSENVDNKCPMSEQDPSRCYYLSTSSVVDVLFEEISNKIVQYVNNQSVSNIEISGTVNNSFFVVKDSEGNILNNINFSFNVTSDEQYYENKSYYIDFKNDADFTNKKVFTTLKVKFKDLEGRTLTTKNIPSPTITKKSTDASYLN